MDTNQTVAKKSKQFAIHVMKLVEHLRKNKRPYFIIDQVGRSGTSIGANVMEAEHAITQKEFCRKCTSPIKSPMKRCTGWNCCLRVVMLLQKVIKDYIRSVMK